MPTAKPNHGMQRAALRLSLGLAVLLSATAPVGADPLRVLLAPERAAQMLYVSEGGGLFKHVPAIGELWRVDETGAILERGFVQQVSGFVAITWQTGERMHLTMDQNVTVLETMAGHGQTAALAKLVESLTAQTGPIALDLDMPAMTFGADLSLRNDAGEAIGTWQPTPDGLLLERTGFADTLLSISQLDAALKSIGAQSLSKGKAVALTPVTQTESK